VKIRSITIQGFRGFNAERGIQFHEGLTLIYAPNSYGKTSISEALEWLLYGITSKVEGAAYSKDEYKGSYRNVHLPKCLVPFVKVIFVDGPSEAEFRAELGEDDSIRRLVNGAEAETWPLPCDPSELPRPFVLQHALKRLLLVKPDERFQGFASLLGLEDLERIQRDVVSLCTKPDAAIPDEVQGLVGAIGGIGERLDAQPSLAVIAKAFRKGAASLDETYELIATECKQRVPPDTDEGAVAARLSDMREEAVGKVFKGHIALPSYSPAQKSGNSEEEQFFLGCVTEPFVQDYVGLIALATVQHVLDRADFYDLGLALLAQTPGRCPFCGQAVGDAVSDHIRAEHERATREKQGAAALKDQRHKVEQSLGKLRNRLSEYHERHSKNVESLHALQASLPNIKSILVPKHRSHFAGVETAVPRLESAAGQLEDSYATACDALDNVESSISEAKEDAALAKALGAGLVKYIAKARSFAQAVSKNESAMSDAEQVLQHELDALAGTEDISVLIDLLGRRRDIQRKFRIDAVLGSLKDLRKSVDQYVANKVFEAVSGDLSSEVMKWYGEIRTTGDPDVHFDGFDMERTASGALKGRRVQIKAVSYGEELVSAVSSLSESKLNALGLCVSIAENLKGDSPFEFLVIDDPIQSWDAEHETQFIQVIRRLVERGKQVILLSHNKVWIERVCKGCRSLNGWYYEITGYTKAGPEISEVSWVKWARRLEEVDAILKDPTASTTTLQRAEEEIRIAIEEIVPEVCLRRRGVHTSSHRLDAVKVRKLLVECGVEASLVDRISGTFETTSPAHHAEPSYAPDRERIRRYHSWAHELAKLLGNG